MNKSSNHVGNRVKDEYFTLHMYVHDACCTTLWDSTSSIYSVHVNGSPWYNRL